MSFKVQTNEGICFVKLRDKNSSNPISVSVENEMGLLLAEMDGYPQILKNDLESFASSWISGRTITSADTGNLALLKRVLCEVSSIRKKVAQRVIRPSDGSLVRGVVTSLNSMGKSTVTLLPKSFEYDIRLLISRLDQQIGATPSGICHNDLHLGNIMVSGSNIVLVDWEYAGFGVDLLEVASLLNAWCGSEVIMGMFESIYRTCFPQYAPEILLTAAALLSGKDALWVAIDLSTESRSYDKAAALSEYLSIYQDRLEAARIFF